MRYSSSPIYTDIGHDFVEIATDLEIDNPEVNIVHDSGEHVSEIASQHFLNELDSDNIESAVLISSDDMNGDGLIADNIQERLESEKDSINPQRSEIVEIDEFEGDFFRLINFKFLSN